MKPRDHEVECPNCGHDEIIEISVSPFTTNAECTNCGHTDNIDQFAVEDEQERADQIANYYDYQ